MRTKRKSKGFTLIEVLIAMTIMVIGLLALWNMHISSVRSDAFSNNLSKAILCAEQKIEEMKAEDFSTLSSGSDNTDKNCNQASSNSFYRREWTVSDYAISLTNTKEVNVTVGWSGSGCLSDINNCSHKIQITTIIVDTSNL